jgi:hypothetical protein
MTLHRIVVFSSLIILIAAGAFCTEPKVEVKFKETSPITTAYGYELGRGKPGDTFEVQETRGPIAFGFCPSEAGGTRGYVLLAHLESTDELRKFMDAEKSRRNKLDVALEKKVELLQLPQPPGKTLTKYVEEKERDFMTVRGVMLESTTWTKDKSPYLINGPIYVPSGMILFIDPGVEIYCEKSENPGARISSGQVNGIIVAGNILAIGRPEQAISFRGFRSKPTDRNTWGGITILGSADPGSIFRWAIFENAATAISCGRGPVISNCIFRYNYSAVLLDETSDSAIVSNNIIMNNNTGLEARGTPSTVEIFNNIIAYNQPNGGIRAWQGAEPLMAYNNMYQNEQDYIGWSPYSTDLLANPMFADIKNGDYHINEHSPLIGRGRGKSNIGLYGGRDAIHVPREKAVVIEEKKEEKGGTKEKEKEKVKEELREKGKDEKGKIEKEETKEKSKTK